MTPDEDRPWARPTDHGWVLDLRVQPNASRTEVAGRVGAQLKVKVAAPPNEGKANAALVRFLAEALGVKERQVRVRQGVHGRSKVVEVEGAVALPPAWDG